MNELSIQAKSRPPSGFTLTELAVVIAVVGLLGVMALAALAQSRPQSHLIYCANNLRQVGLGFHMYQADFWKLPQLPNGHGFEYDFMYPQAQNSPMHVLRPYWGFNNTTRVPRLLYCPAAKPYPTPPGTYAPSSWTDCNLVVSQLVLEKGLNWGRNPAGLVMIQEFLYRINGALYQPEKSGDSWSQWHVWTSSRTFMWLGPPDREYYSSVHDLGGNLLYVDGHVGYKRYLELNSLDFGLVDSSGQADPYQPTEAQSWGTFYPAY